MEKSIKRFFDKLKIKIDIYYRYKLKMDIQNKYSLSKVDNSIIGDYR